MVYQARKNARKNYRKNARKDDRKNMNGHNEHLIIGIDSATNGCSVALMAGGRVLASVAKEMSRGQAEELMLMVDGTLKEAAVTPADLDMVAVSIGPGSFTGLRIGLAAARGLALSLSIPCIGVSTFETCAKAVDEKSLDGQSLLVAVETRRDDIYAQLFDKNLNPLSDGAAMSAAGLGLLVAGNDVVVAGDGGARAVEMLGGCECNAQLLDANIQPGAVEVCAIAGAKYTPGEIPPPPQPLYLRPPEAKIPQPKIRT